MSSQDLDTIVIGAGVVGSSVAMHLAMSGQRVAVLDKDLSGELSSSTRNAGGARTTWTTPVNMQLALDTITYLGQVSEDEAAYPNHRPIGYLWFRKPEEMDEITRALELQRTKIKGHGEVELLSPDQISERFPFFDKLEGIAGATYATPDGTLDPHGVREHYRHLAKLHGAQFVDNAQVGEVHFDKRGVQVTTTNTNQYRAARIVNCAGAWAPELAKMMGYSIPTKAVRRQISIFDFQDERKEEILRTMPFCIDTSGVYFHADSGHILAGYADLNEQEGINFDYDGADWFTEFIWSPLAQRSTAFERSKHQRGWAGLFSESPDHSAIIGEVEAQAVPSGKVYEAHSFSGHGVMQSYAAGKVIAELMNQGRIITVPQAQLLSASRFKTGSSEVKEPFSYVI